MNSGTEAQGFVLGTVKVWGCTIEGTDGYRAEYAKIIALVTDDPEPYEAVMAQTRLISLAEVALEVVSTALAERDVRTAVAVLRGVGLLPGHVPPIGPSSSKGVAERTNRAVINGSCVSGFHQERRLVRRVEREAFAWIRRSAAS